MSTLRLTDAPQGSPMAGNATVMALMSVCVILAIGAASMTVMTAKQAVVRRAVDVDQAYMIAEAGVDLALSEIRGHVDHDADGLGVVQGLIGRGTFTVTVAPPFTGPGAYTITSTGRVSSVARTIEVEIGQQANNAGFLADMSINMPSGIVDTYDSAIGTYSSQVSGTHAGDGAVVRSNSNILLGGSAKVYGDATPGPTGTVTGSAGVTGSTAPAAATVPLTTYTYAPPIASMGALSTSKVFTSGQYRYSTFTIGGGKTATFNGEVELWVDGNFTISGSGQGVLAPGAHLTIHHGAGTFTISGSGVLNQDQRPSSLSINSASTSTVTVSGGGSFYGTMLAPKAALVASGSAGIFGSVQAKSMTLTGGMCLHYDRALGGGGALQVDLLRPRGGTARKS